MKGFSPRNLKYMRKFAESWNDEEFVQQTAAQIPWFHNCGNSKSNVQNMHFANLHQLYEA